MWIMELYFTQVNKIQTLYQILLEFSYISEVKNSEALVGKNTISNILLGPSDSLGSDRIIK